MLLDSLKQVQKVMVKLSVTLNAPRQAISVVIPDVFIKLAFKTMNILILEIPFFVKNGSSSAF